MAEEVKKKRGRPKSVSIRRKPPGSERSKTALSLFISKNFLKVLDFSVLNCDSKVRTFNSISNSLESVYKLNN